MRRILSYIVFTLLSITSVLADNVVMRVSAPSTVEAGEKFRVQYIVNTSSATNFSTPDFEGLDVIYGPSTSTESSYQIINGKASQSSSITYTFIVMAAKEGTYNIPASSVKVEGKVIRSGTAKVKVLPSSGNNNSNSGSNSGTQRRSSRGRASSSNSSAGNISSSDLFMTASASKTNVHEQEAILLTYKIYTLVNLTQLDGKLPTLDGFQIQEVPLPRNKEFELETYNGRTYHTVVWSQYVLFPQKSGKLVIPSISYEGLVVQPNTNIDPIDAFFNGTGGMIETKKTIVTPKLTINVSPLPTKPEGFSGAVGQFSVTSSINSTEVTTDDAITLKVNVKGVGNMKLINTPTIEFPKDFETYDAKVTDNFNLTRNGLSGTKQFEYLAVPRHPGKYTIPALKFVFFDTASDTYKTITTQSYEIKVNKGSGKSSHTVANFTGGQEDVKLLNSDIHYIKLGDVEHSSKGSMFGTLRYWLYYAGLVILSIIVAVFVYRQKKDNSNIAKLRLRKANKVARTRMKKAHSLLNAGKQAEFYEEVLRALQGYISDKLNIPQEQLSRDNIRQSLTDKGVAEDDINKFMTVIDDCEYARFAPGNANDNMNNAYNSAISAIDSMERNKPIK